MATDQPPGDPAAVFSFLDIPDARPRSDRALRLADERLVQTERRQGTHLMADRFLVLRGSPAGPVFLATPNHYGDADTWTEERDEARGFSDGVEADEIRDEIVARAGFAVAVVPDRVGPGLDRPEVHR